MSKKDIYYDNTMMSTYQTCQRKFLLRHLRGIVPKSKPQALEFGSAIHEGLSTWYETGDEQQALEDAFRDYTDDPMDEKRSSARGREILKKYFKQYPKEPFDIVANEVPFEQQLFSDDSYRYNLIGKIDLVINWHGGLYGFDHKTTSRLGKYYFNQYTLSRQFMGYTMAMKRIYSDIAKKVQGFYINAIAVYKNKFKFERSLQTYNSHKLGLYDKYIPRLMNEMAFKQERYEKTKDETLFIPNWGNCELYGHCPYKPICTSLRPENVIERNYTIDFWDPRDEFDKKDGE